MKKTAAIVVTYNRNELLAENIAHLLAQSMRSQMDIIVIDNASTDGTEESLKTHIQENNIIYLNTGANLGGAGGFQYGMRYAAEQHYDFLWVMDDDSMPSPDALEELLKWNQKLSGNYGFLSSKILWTDGSICNMNVQKVSISKKASDFTSDCVPIITGTFVSAFFPVERIFEFGLPIKEFFLWCDDLEYTRRISQKYPCYLINASTVTHKSSTNIGSNIAADAYERLNRYGYAYRNEIYFFRREGLRGWSYCFCRLILHISRVILKAEDHRMKRLKIILTSTWKGFFFHPEIEYVQPCHVFPERKKHHISRFGKTAEIPDLFTVIHNFFGKMAE
ncbi:MAG: glycosyltransferase family 2 protein [Clostridiales bacterium]|nr:glycosyltransferase family 2 protein [Clostridiales bacterium]